MNQLIDKAKDLSIAFAQVREDALLDLEVIEKLGSDLSILMIASGGCTSALLATSEKIAKMHLVDINPAQLALCQLKIKLLSDYSIAERLEILGHQPVSPINRRKVISELLSSLGYAENALCPLDTVAKYGLDYIGRSEALFAEVAKQLKGIDRTQPDIIADDMLANRLPEAESIYNIEQVLTEVMDLSNLVALFGEDATQHAERPFYHHFIDQTYKVLANTGINSAENPYLQQILLGRFLPNVYYPWITQTAPEQLPEIQYSHGNMLNKLQNSCETYHFIHLSNILDWLDEEQAATLLAIAYHRLNKGGCVFIRQLNSKLDIARLGNKFCWDDDYAAALLQKDRSFLYPKLHVGFKR